IVCLSTSILPQVDACCLFFTTFEAGVNFSLSLLFCAKNPFLYTFFWGKFIFDLSLIPWIVRIF
ncbi:hypothetical protein, partial [Carboxydocella sporoproducens]|uniref:hypothetical protein n=1 Tax=Carboxydocella sporoproducens TaxID=285110 RepID=UPI001A9A6BA1